MRKRRLRLAMAILLLICIPVLCFAAYSYHGMTGLFRERQTAYLMQSVQQYMTAIERLLYSTSVAADSFIQSSSRQEIMLETMNGEKFQTYQEIRRELLRLQPFDAITADACLISVYKKWLINNAGLYRFEDAENLVRYQRYFENPPMSGWESFFPSEQDVADSKYDAFFSEAAVHLVKSIPLGERINVRGLLLVKIPCDYLRQLLDVSDDVGRLLVLDENDRVVACSSGESLGADYSHMKFMQDVKARGDSAGNIVLDEGGRGNKTEVVYSRSDYNGWTSVLTVPDSSLSADYYRLGLTLVTISVSIFLFVLVGSSMLSRKAYEPVSEIIRAIDRPGYKQETDPFAYISQEIDSLHSRYLAAISEAGKQKQPIREYLTIAVLLGSLSGDSIQSRLELFSNLSEGQQKTVLVLRPDSKSIEDDPERLGVMMTAIQRTVAETFAHELAFTPVIIEQSLCVILCLSDENEQDFYAHAKRVAAQLLGAVESDGQTMFAVGIGTIFRGVEGAAKSYREALSALASSILYSGENVFVFAELVNIRSLRPQLYMRAQERLLAAVKTADRDNVSACLDEFFDEVFQQGLLRNEWMVPMMNLLTELIALRQDMSPDFSTRRGDGRSLYDEFMDCQTQDRMRRWLLDEMIEPYMEDVCRLFNTQQRQLAMRAQEMIEERFDKGLTLEECAEALNYHPAHLRKVFLDVTGRTFGDCLSQRKLDAAKAWLRETEMTVQEIAEKLGYSNSQNFIRYFRAGTGETPGSYRKHKRTDQGSLNDGQGG